MFKREACPIGSILRPGQSDTGVQSWAVTLAEISMGAAAKNNSAASRARVDSWVARMCRCGASLLRTGVGACIRRPPNNSRLRRFAEGGWHPHGWPTGLARRPLTLAPALHCLPLYSPLPSVIYAPEASCNSTDAAPGLNVADLAVQRIAEDYKPTTVKLLAAALAAMPNTTRKQLNDGLSKQVDSIPGLVAMLPKELKAPLLSAACYVATPLQTLAVDPNAPLLDHVAAGKAYSNEALDLVGLLVGDDKAVELRDKLCADLPKAQPVGADAADGTTTAAYVKDKLTRVARGGMGLLHGIARLGKLLPSSMAA